MAKGTDNKGTSNGNKRGFDPAILFRPTSNAQAVWTLLWPTLRKGTPLTMLQLVTAWETVIADRKLDVSGNTQSASARANEYRNWCVRTDTWKRDETGKGYILGSRFDNCNVKTKPSKGKRSNVVLATPKPTAEQNTAEQTANTANTAEQTANA